MCGIRMGRWCSRLDIRRRFMEGELAMMHLSGVGRFQIGFIMYYASG